MPDRKGLGEASTEVDQQQPQPALKLCSQMAVRDVPRWNRVARLLVIHITESPVGLPRVEQELWQGCGLRVGNPHQ